MKNDSWHAAGLHIKRRRAHSPCFDRQRVLHSRKPPNGCTCPGFVLRLFARHRRLDRQLPRDAYAHVAKEGPDEARRTYLVEVADPAIAQKAKALEKRGALRDRFVVVTSGHGHTQVSYDDVDALSTNEVDDPPAVVKGAGFRLRPFALEVSPKAGFNTFIASGCAEQRRSQCGQ